MIGIEQRSVCDGVNFRSIRDTKFKTVRMSVNFLLPIQKQTAASNAILPFLLSRASREYPDFTGDPCNRAALGGSCNCTEKPENKRGNRKSLKPVCRFRKKFERLSAGAERQESQEIEGGISGQ